MGSQIEFTKVVIALLFAGILTGCDKNFFDGLGDPNTEAALLIEAQKSMNARDYDAALVALQTLPLATQARRDVVVQMASAHSGKCGMEMLSMVESLADASTDSILGLLFEAFPKSALEQTVSCQIAENLLRGIGDETVRSVSENLLVAFNALAEIGTTLSTVADTDADGVVDSGLDHCDTSTISDDQVDQIGGAIALTLNSFLGIGEDFADVQDIKDQCDTFPGFSRICTLEDGGFDPLELKAIRAFIGSTDMGLGSCGNMASASCLCP